MRLTSAYSRTKCSLRAHFVTDAEKERFRALLIGGWVLPQLLQTCRLLGENALAAVGRFRTYSRLNLLAIRRFLPWRTNAFPVPRSWQLRGRCRAVQPIGTRPIRYQIPASVSPLHNRRCCPIYKSCRRQARQTICLLPTKSCGAKVCNRRGRRPFQNGAG